MGLRVDRLEEDRGDEESGAGAGLHRLGVQLVQVRLEGEDFLYGAQLDLTG